MLTIPAALPVTAPHPAPCGAAAPAVPAARCRRLSVSLSAVSLAYSAFHAFTGRAVLPIITKARVGAQARTPCAPPPFRLPSAPSSCAGWAVCLPGVLAIAAHFVDTELAKRGRRWQKNMLLFKSANYKGVEL